MPSLPGASLAGRLIRVLAAAILCFTTPVQADHKEGLLVDCLQQIPKLDVVLPSDRRAYKNATSVWELKTSPSFPVAVIIPDSAQQIQAAVKCAAEAKIRVVPKSGGHSYEGWYVRRLSHSCSDALPHSRSTLPRSPGLCRTAHSASTSRQWTV